MNWKKFVIGKWDWTRPFKSLAFIYVALCLVACGFSNKFIFYPPPAQYTAKASRLQMLPGKDGRQVAAFWYPPQSPDDPVLLWSHGNAEDLGGLAPLYTELRAQGVGILGYDYPGYGLSDGSPTERGCYEAADAAVTFLTTHENIPVENILLVGQSVGSGPACYLAEHHNFRGLVLISPFRTAFLTATRIPLFPGDKFKNIKRIDRIDEPLVVIHGKNDKTIPFTDGKALYERHGGPKRFIAIPDAHHNNIWHRGLYTIIEAMKDLPTGPDPAAPTP